MSNTPYCRCSAVQACRWLRICSPMPIGAQGWPIMLIGTLSKSLLTARPSPYSSTDALRGDRIAQRLQPAMAIAGIRLQMRALGPFVPGVDEQQTLLAHQELPDLLDLFLDIDAERLGAGSVEAGACQRLPRRVVPAWEHRGIARIGDGLAPDELDNRLRIIVAIAAPFRLDDRRRRLGGGGEAMRRELNAGIEAEIGGADRTIHRFHALDIDEMHPDITGTRERGTAAIGEGTGVGQQQRPIDEEDGLAGRPDIARGDRK